MRSIGEDIAEFGAGLAVLLALRGFGAPSVIQLVVAIAAASGLALLLGRMSGTGWARWGTTIKYGRVEASVTLVSLVAVLVVSSLRPDDWGLLAFLAVVLPVSVITRWILPLRRGS